MAPEGYTRADLEPLSFDDLPLGGEWTTRRRTVSESDIALYAGVAGDFSPLTIEAAHGPRTAPPALVLAMAIGLGSMDMPVPSVAEWEWLNWRFPCPVHAGDTIFARWTLTQKRPPARDAASSIVVWRVDVHKLDGTLCAEGEVGAKIKRHTTTAARSVAKEPDATAAAGPGAGPRRRRRRRPGTNGHTPEVGATAALPAPPPAQPAKSGSQTAPPAKTGGQTGTPAKRRRRRRAPSAASVGRPDVAASTSSTNAAMTAAPAPTPEPSAPVAPSQPVQRAGVAAGHGTLGRVISRLRRTQP